MKKNSVSLNITPGTVGSPSITKPIVVTIHEIPNKFKIFFFIASLFLSDNGKLIFFIIPFLI